MNLMDIVATLRADIADFEHKLAQAANQMEGLGPKAEVANKSLASVASSMTDIAGSATRMGGILSASVTAPLAGLALGAVKVAAGMEQAKMGFATLLGSAEKATAFLEELRDFALKTPFELTGVVSATQKLMAMGFAAQEAIPTLRAIGDAVAASGRGQEVMDRIILAFGQMKAKGRVAGQEILQLAEANIPAWQMLADKLGVTVPEAMKMVENRAVEADTAIAAITEGMNKKFGGMMENQAKTLAGMWSNFKDNTTKTLDAIGQALLPIAKMFVEWAVKITEAAQKVAEVFGALPRPIQLTLVAITALVAAAGPLALMFGGATVAVTTFTTSFRTLKTALGGYLTESVAVQAANTRTAASFTAVAAAAKAAGTAATASGRAQAAAGVASGVSSTGGLIGMGLSSGSTIGFTRTLGTASTSMKDFAVATTAAEASVTRLSLMLARVPQALAIIAGAAVAVKAALDFKEVLESERMLFNRVMQLDVTRKMTAEFKSLWQEALKWLEDNAPTTFMRWSKAAQEKVIQAFKGISWTDILSPMTAVFRQSMQQLADAVGDMSGDMDKSIEDLLKKGAGKDPKTGQQRLQGFQAAIDANRKAIEEHVNKLYKDAEALRNAIGILDLDGYTKKIRDYTHALETLKKMQASGIKEVQGVSIGTAIAIAAEQVANAKKEFADFQDVSGRALKALDITPVSQLRQKLAEMQGGLEVLNARWVQAAKAEEAAKIVYSDVLSEYEKGIASSDKLSAAKARLEKATQKAADAHTDYANASAKVNELQEQLNNTTQTSTDVTTQWSKIATGLIDRAQALSSEYDKAVESHKATTAVVAALYAEQAQLLEQQAEGVDVAEALADVNRRLTEATDKDIDAARRQAQTYRDLAEAQQNAARAAQIARTAMGNKPVFIDPDTWSQIKSREAFDNLFRLAEQLSRTSGEFKDLGDAAEMAKEHLDNFSKGVTEEGKAWEQLGSQSSVALQKQVEATRKTLDAIKNSTFATQHDIDLATRDHLRAQVELYKALGQKIPPEIEKALDQVERRLGEHTGFWKDAINQISTVFTDLGKSIADRIWNWGSENKQLRKQEEELKKSLAEREKEWDEYVTEIAQKFADLDSEYAENIEKATREYEEFVAETTDRLAEIRQAHSDELERETREVKDGVAEQEQAYNDFAEDTAAALRELYEDQTRELTNALQDMDAEFADRRADFDVWMADTADRLADRIRSLNEQAEDERTRLQRSLRDKEADYAAYEAEVNRRMWSLRGPDSALEAQELRASLNERRRELENYRKDVAEDLDTISKRLEKNIADEEADTKRTVDARTAEWDRYVDEFTRRAKEITEENKRETKKQEESLRNSLNNRLTDLENYKREAAQRLASITAQHAAELAKEESDLQKSLQERKLAFDEYLAEQAEAYARATTDLQSEYAKREEDFNAYLADLNEQLAAIRDAYKGFFGEIGDLLTGFVSDMGKAMTRLIAEEATRKLFDALKEEIDAGIELAKEAIGKLVGWIGGLFGFGGGGGIQIPTTVPGTNTPINIPGVDLPGPPSGGSIPSESDGGGGSGGGGGSTGTGAAIGGWVGGPVGAAIGAAIGGIVDLGVKVWQGFTQMRQEGTLNAIEHNTRYTEVTINGADGISNNIKKIRNAVIDLDDWVTGGGIFLVLRGIEDAMWDIIGKLGDLSWGLGFFPSTLLALVGEIRGALVGAEGLFSVAGLEASLQNVADSLGGMVTGSTETGWNIVAEKLDQIAEILTVGLTVTFPDTFMPAGPAGEVIVASPPVQNITQEVRIDSVNIYCTGVTSRDIVDQIAAELEALGKRV
jgi:tape measure domain-containing protein